MFRSMSRLLLASLFVLLILGAGTRDDPSLVYNSETVKLVFDDTYTSQGIVLARIECEVMNETGVIVSTWGLTTGWTMVGPECASSYSRTSCNAAQWLVPAQDSCHG